MWFLEESNPQRQSRVVGARGWGSCLMGAVSAGKDENGLEMDGV